MLPRWPIRNKLLAGLALLVVIVSTLGGSGILGLYAYRGLVKSLGWRLSVLPLASELSRRVSDLRVTVRSTNPLKQFRPAAPSDRVVDALAREEFRVQYESVCDALVRYRQQLAEGEQQGPRIRSLGYEWQNVRAIEECLKRIAQIDQKDDWVFDPDRLATLTAELETLQQLTGELPSSLYKNINDFSQEVRAENRALITVGWVAAGLAVLLLSLYVGLFYLWVFRPLKVLIHGSRQVASGQFDYRIELDTRDEMAELAAAMNDMTARFRAIRDDLDRQVRERTKQVVRSEQMASVGFLAAGVAHEINNPLASIALCAESLESRIAALVPRDDSPEHEVVFRYARMIQEEAFRCKGITERLLDFSRVGEVRRQTTEIRELISGVIDMVGHLGANQDKRIVLVPGEPVYVVANGQEMKQVALNLITNALDSLDAGGEVRVSIDARGDTAEIAVADNGCGMTPEVLKHLFEPFFTRRRSGQGTGLGLSITYRIVTEHGGTIEATSPGPGAGSLFRLHLPLAHAQQENGHRNQAA